MLSSNSYVHVFALDFSKAFDSVRHQTLMEKVAKLDITDNICDEFSSQYPFLSFSAIVLFIYSI